MSPVNKKGVPRCPYCVSGTQFKAMRVLENEREICENCGHIAFSNDNGFRCPCQKCLKLRTKLVGKGATSRVGMRLRLGVESYE